MVGTTLKKILAKGMTSVMALTVCVGASGFSSFAEETDPLQFDHDTNLVNMVMDSADELVEDPYENMVVSNYEPYLAVYENADSDSEIVGKLYPVSYGEIIEQDDEWTKILSGDVTGYVPTKDVAVGEDAKQLARKNGIYMIKVTVDELNIRSGPNFVSEVIESGKKDETYRIVPEDYEYDSETQTVVRTDAAEDESNSTTEEINLTETEEINSVQGTVLAEETDDKKEVEANQLYEALQTPIEDAQGNSWYRIYIGSGYYGYVFGDCVEMTIQLEEAVSMEEEQEAALKKETLTADHKQTDNENGLATDSKNPESDESLNGQTQAPETAAPETAEPIVPETPAPETEAPETSAPDTDVSAPSVGSDEAYLLAALVYCEAGAQSYEGQLGVANVVMNRVRSPYFPNTITEVIYEANQFGPVYNGSLDRALANGPSASAIQAAQAAIAGENNIGNYLFFNNVAPSDASSVYVIGPHVFYTYSWL
ncbi:MAG: cell wall hydrolase [Catenibacillus sp.]